MGMESPNQTSTVMENSSVIMEYVGGFSDLPIMTCIFHTGENYNIDTSIKFGHAFQVSKDEFTHIQKAIEEYSKSKKGITSHDMYYRFRININDQEKTFCVTKKADALVVLNKIIPEISKNKLEKEINGVLFDTITRLPEN